MALTTKADIISGMCAAIHSTRNEITDLQFSDFKTMTEVWKIEDELIANIDNLYKEIRQVLDNQDILN